MPTINLNNATPAPPSGETNVNWRAASPPEALSIIGVSDSGGLFEIELASTDYLVTGDSAVIVCPAFAAIQGQWQITVVDPTHCTLNGSAYSAGWTSYAGGIMLAARDVSAYMPVMVGDGGSPPTGGLSGAVPAPPPGSAAAGEFLRADATWAAPAGGGTVTNSGTLASGDPVFGNGGSQVIAGTKSGNTTEVVTQSGAATANRPLLYDANGNAIAGAVQGNTTMVQMASGSPTTGYALVYDANGNAIPASGPPGVNPMTTEGDIIYGGASGAPTRLPAGTSGDVLQTNGSGAAPSWVAPSGGGGGGSTYGTSVYENVNQNVASATLTALTFNTVIRDDIGAYSSGAPTKLTIPSGGAGWYAVTGAINAGGAVSYTVTLDIEVNGTLILFSCGLNAPAVYGLNVSGLIYLNVGDYVQLFFAQYSGSTANYGGAALAIVRIN